jgi:DNA-binding response OmpR family regulator
MKRTSTNDEEDGQAGDGSRILVIDDEEIIHVSLKRILGRHGHHVDAVFAAPEAMELLSSREYDLVITDLMMPDINGIQLLENMRAEGHEVPVLMITGYPTIRTALHALRLGAVDYLSKPFTRSELLGPVNRTLRRAAAPSSNSAGREAPSLTKDEELDLAAGDRFHLREHSWAVYQQDGKVRMGIEASFLGAIDTVTSLELPGESDIIEQGFVGFKLTTRSGELHSVFVPLSGQVVEVNQEALADPSSVGAETWLVLVQPNRLETELPLLLKGNRSILRD